MKVYLLDLSKLKMILALGLAVVLISLLFAGALVKEPPTTPAQGKVQPVYKVKTNKKVAALTFNVNWGTRVAGEVLEILKKQDVRATFFVSGSWAKKYPEAARRITAEGHQLASYGDRQIFLGAEGKATIRDEIGKSRRFIKESTGQYPSLMRPPYGDWNEALLETAAEEGCTLVLWSVDSLDIQTPGAPVIVNNVMNKIHPGAIVMMSASDTAAQTPEALPRVIDGLKSEGYSLLTVQELLKAGPAVID